MKNRPKPKPDPNPPPPCSVRRLLAGPLRRLQYFERERHTCEVVAGMILARRRARGLRSGPRAKRLEEELRAGVRFVEDRRGAIVRADSTKRSRHTVPSPHVLGHRTRNIPIPHHMLVWRAPHGCGFCDLTHPRKRCPLAPDARRPKLARPKRSRARPRPSDGESART